ncbi:glycosyl hydrolase [Paenibacillus sp. PAMC21692]|uniref:glycosyl hydrolase n=1 Tax=Paenibacillus sp. PAMC21692 TaxID=2762320 RepID=UPI00164DB985|nr:glycosyl hydrolase [Paenibacillus sp. PAMC21692]QNK58582.1 hypothetical protein H7F31_06660 [Paenibacillus sp. PAMC21692]
MLKNRETWTKGCLSFWSWNDKLEPEKLIGQLEQFRKAGMHGVFLHARGGLQTEYMGEDWLAAVGVCVDYARQYDMEIWLYDEDAWPSGFCGGKVPQTGERHQQKWLEYEWIAAGLAAPGPRTIALYRKQDGGRWTIVSRSESLPANEELLHVYYNCNSYYSDLLNPQTVRLFIDSTHEVYKNNFSEDFGKTIRGIFTDEPQYAAGKYPWSEAIAPYFAQLQGYDLLSILPDLLVGCEDAMPVKHDYWQTISSLFVKSYAEQVGMWCDENRLCFTGHFACEDTLKFQMTAVGDVMRKYEWMHMPGIDHLGNRTTRPVILKQVASVANQLGKKQVLSEMFGCSGWSVSFRDLKYIADWHYSMGVNVQCQHLAAYSLRGRRKRDYPPSLSYHQPWWKDYTLYTNYAEEAHRWITRGQAASNVLVLHPLTSAWCVHDSGNPREVWELDRRLGELTELLASMKVQFDYGDEHLLQKYGEVNEGTLRIGEMSYRAVILPSLLSIEPATFAILKQFREQGGTIISAGESPARIAGSPSPELKLWCREHIRQVMPIRKALEAVLPEELRQLTIYNGSGALDDILYANERHDGETSIYFLYNREKHRQWSGMLQWKGTYRISLITIGNDDATDLAVTYEDEQSLVRLDMEGGGSALLVVVPVHLEAEGGPGVLHRSQEVIPTPYAHYSSRTTIALTDTWELTTPLDNRLVLDYCQYRLHESEQWSERIHHLRLQEQLTELRRQVEIQLRYEVHIQEDFDLRHSLRIVLEDAEKCTLYLNGNPLFVDDTHEWLDPAMLSIKLPSGLKHGINELIIHRTFRSGESDHSYSDEDDVFETETNRYFQATELECIYVTGEFAVIPGSSSFQDTNLVHVCRTQHFIIAPQQNKIKPEDLTSQGFWSYAGEVEIKTNLPYAAGDDEEEIYLELASPQATVIGLDVNGQQLGSRAWEPYLFRLTPYLREGNNVVTLRLTSGLRNLLGPHHHVDGNPSFVGPSSFKGKSGWEDHIFAYNPPDVTWSDHYHFVPFGTGQAPIVHVVSGKVVVTT